MTVKGIPTNYKDLETRDLRELLKTISSETGEALPRLHKMGRAELLKKVAKYVESKETKPVEEKTGYESPTPAKPAEEEADLQPLEDKIEVKHFPTRVEECILTLFDAFRLYVHYDMYRNSDRKNDPETKEYLKAARAKLTTVVGLCLNCKGEGYEKANKLAAVIDRALGLLRYDLCDTLVAHTVLTTLLSDKHQVEMAAIRGDN